MQEVSFWQRGIEEYISTDSWFEGKEPFRAFTRVAPIDVYFYPKYSKAIAINQALICLAYLPQSQSSSLSYMSKMIFQVRFGTKTSKWVRAIIFWSSSLPMWCYPSCHWADCDKLATFEADQGWPEGFHQEFSKNCRWCHNAYKLSISLHIMQLEFWWDILT